MRPLRFPLPAVLLALATGCQQSPQPAESNAQPAPSESSIPLTRFREDSIAYALVTGFHTPTTVAIRDSSAWAAAWVTLHAGFSPVPSLPAVDFSKDMVVLAAMGTRNTGGYNLLLQTATGTTDAITVRGTASTPGAGCFTTQALTSPADIGLLPRQDAPVVFDIASTVYSCEP